jgi:hypothetical protein
MPDLPFLEQYSGQSADQLIALEGQYRIDSIVLAFDEAVGQKQARLGSDALTDAERVILSVGAMEREVNNGGYHQFFTNTAREYAAILVESLNSINCPHAARIAQRAIDALRIDGPVTPESIEAAISNDALTLEEALSSLDDEYYNNPEPIAENLFHFLKNHKAEIQLQ